MSFEQVLDSVDEQMVELIGDVQSVRADKCGMDIRAGHALYLIPGEGIVVRKTHDNVLQYYGGFEYVDKMFRWELGSWVFYSIEDERVADCFEAYDESE